MEEATELFALQQSILSSLQARSAPPPPPPPATPGSVPSTAPGAPAPIRIDDEGLAYGLLLLGAGAGVLAAVLKRTRDGPAVEPARPR